MTSSSTDDPQNVAAKSSSGIPPHEMTALNVSERTIRTWRKQRWTAVISWNSLSLEMHQKAEEHQN